MYIRLKNNSNNVISYARIWKWFAMQYYSAFDSTKGAIRRLIEKHSFRLEVINMTTKFYKEFLEGSRLEVLHMSLFVCCATCLTYRRCCGRCIRRHHRSPSACFKLIFLFFKRNYFYVTLYYLYVHIDILQI